MSNATPMTFDMTAFEPYAELKGIKVWNDNQLKLFMPPPWLYDGVIQERGCTVIYGEPGSGKSLAAIDLACRVAAWEYSEWFGFRRHRPVKALYIAGEGWGGLDARREAWGRMTGLDNLNLRWIRGATTLWHDPGKGWTDEQMALLTHIAEENYGLVVIDTLANAFGGGDENRQQDMNAFLDSVRKMQELGAAVLIVHHTSKEGSLRGSTVLHGFADTVIMAKAEVRDGLLQRTTFELKKQKDGEAWGRKLHAVPVRTEDSLALREFDPASIISASKKEEIYEYIADHGPVPWREVRDEVRGKTTKLMELRRELEEEDRIYEDEEGWYVNEDA